MSDNIEVLGLDDVRKVLRELAPNHAYNLGRSTVHGIAQEIAKEAKKTLPEREGKTLKKGTRALRRKPRKGEFISDVVVTRGKDARYNAFYWRYLEHGTKSGLPEGAYFRKAKEKVQSNLPMLLNNVFRKKLAGAIKRELRKREK